MRVVACVQVSSCTKVPTAKFVVALARDHKPQHGAVGELKQLAGEALAPARVTECVLLHFLRLALRHRVSCYELWPRRLGHDAVCGGVPYRRHVRLLLRGRDEGQIAGGDPGGAQAEVAVIAVVGWRMVHRSHAAGGRRGREITGGERERERA